MSVLYKDIPVFSPMGAKPDCLQVLITTSTTIVLVLHILYSPVADTDFLEDRACLVHR